jgi:chitodextrinase
VVGTATIGGRTWEVWRGNPGWNVVSYVAPSAISSLNFSVLDFINDVRTRGVITNSWYLTSIQAGFEPWIGGTGLAVTAFSAAVNGGGNPNPGNDTQAPSVPGQPTASNVTSTGLSLAWSASTDNVGVTSYEILRSTAGGAATVVGTSTGTSFNGTGLSANTTYTFQVRARDAAGNTSGASPGRTVTTPGGGGPTPGPGGCTATYRVTSSWNGGFNGEVTIRNTGTATIAGWTAAWTRATGVTINSLWQGIPTHSGQNTSVRNEHYNGGLAPNGTAAFGFSAAGPSAPAPAVSCTTS